MRVTGDDTVGALVGISFDTAFRAQEFLLAARGLHSAEKLRLNDAVIVVKDDQGRTMVQETTDPQAGRSAWSGAVWSGLFGLLVGGPVGWVAGTVLGAGTGVAAAKIIDLGISDEWVAWFRDEVPEGTTSVVLLVEDADRDALVAEAERFPGARLVHTTFEEATMRRISDALGTEIPVDYSATEPEAAGSTGNTETATTDPTSPEPG